MNIPTANPFYIRRANNPKALAAAWQKHFNNRLTSPSSHIKESDLAPAIDLQRTTSEGNVTKWKLDRTVPVTKREIKKLIGYNERLDFMKIEKVDNQTLIITHYSGN